MPDGGGFESDHRNDLQRIHEMIHHEKFHEYIPENIIRKISEHTENILFQWYDFQTMELWCIFDLLNEYIIQSAEKNYPHIHSGRHREILESLEKENIVINIQRRILDILLPEPIGYRRKYF